MSSIGIIWTYHFNPRAMKIEAAAALNGRTVDYVPNFVIGHTNKTPKFLADFPMGRYAAENGPASAQLLGVTAEQRAVIRQWIGFADHELFEPLTTLILWRYGMAPFNEEAEKSAFQRLSVSLGVLEEQLQSRQYICSEQLSLADISVAAGLYWGFAQVIDRELRAKYSQTTEWYLRVIQDGRIRSAFGEKNFIEVRKISPRQ